MVEIHTQPPNADIFWQGAHQTSPATFDFNWYHVSYNLVVQKPGYEIRREHFYMRPPWWQIIPLDFIVELIPYPFEDRRIIEVILEPAHHHEGAQN